jgi:hypothetical protein
MTPRPLVFRRRHHPVRRFAEDLTFGVTFAALGYGLQWLFREREAFAFLLVLALTLALGFRVANVLRRRKARIVLYEDHVVWYDEKGRHHEAPFSTLLNIQADKYRNEHQVWFQGRGGFTLTPAFAHFTELRHRIQAKGLLAKQVPRGFEPWRVARRFRPGESIGSRIGLGTGLGFVFAYWGSLSGHLAFMGIGGLALLFGLYSLMRTWFEGIEIIGDDLIARTWIPGLRRRFPLGAVVGAARVSDSGHGGAVIDTDLGEIQVRRDIEGIDILVGELERLGAARFARALESNAPASAQQLP